MPVFAYKALDTRGSESAGRVTAESRGGALRQIEDKGLQPVSVEIAGEKEGARAASGHLRVSQASVESFTRELANLLSAGVSLSRSLSILSREAASPAAKRQWAAIHDDVVGGASLADALAKWPKSFSPIYVAMVRAG